jgi:1,6-anhydro-N-acetylmuramate kinase
VFPGRIAKALPARWRWWLAGVAGCPLVPDEEIVLLAPHHARKCLSLNVAEIVSHGQVADMLVEVVGYLSSPLNDVVELLHVELSLGFLREPEPNNCFY